MSDSIHRVKTYQEVAEALDLTPKQLRRWRQDERYCELVPQPDKDGYHYVDQWKRFAKNVVGNDSLDDVGEKRKWEIRRISAQARREELKLQKELGELVDKEEVFTLIQQCVGRFCGSLRKSFVNELPPLLVGMNAMTIRESVEARMNEALKELKDGFAK